MTLTDPSLARPPLPENAGMNTIRLDLALTRDELAATVRQLAAKLNPGRLLSEHSGRILLIGLTLVTVAGSIAVHVADRRSREFSGALKRDV